MGALTWAYTMFVLIPAGSFAPIYSLLRQKTDSQWALGIPCTLLQPCIAKCDPYSLWLWSHSCYNCRNFVMAWHGMECSWVSGKSLCLVLVFQSSLSAWHESLQRILWSTETTQILCVILVKACLWYVTTVGLPLVLREWTHQQMSYSPSC